MAATARWEQLAQKSDNVNSAYFMARYAGTCAACNSRFVENATIRYQDGQIVGQDCCAGTGYHRLVNVMPRGKTAADYCPRCYIIHASGQVHCE